MAGWTSWVECSSMGGRCLTWCDRGSSSSHTTASDPATSHVSSGSLTAVSPRFSPGKLCFIVYIWEGSVWVTDHFYYTWKYAFLIFIIRNNVIVAFCRSPMTYNAEENVEKYLPKIINSFANITVTAIFEKNKLSDCHVAHLREWMYILVYIFFFLTCSLRYFLWFSACIFSILTLSYGYTHLLVNSRADEFLKLF